MMTDYSKRSDGEINMAVAKLMGTYRYVPENLPCDRHLGRNYCNSWADAGPIIQERGIGLMPFKNSLCKAWDLSGGLVWGASCQHQNILRAAMIVFLMMNEGE